MLTMRTDRRDFPPHGLLCGGECGPSWNVVNAGPVQRMLPVTTSKRRRSSATTSSAI